MWSTYIVAVSNFKLSNRGKKSSSSKPLVKYDFLLRLDGYFSDSILGFAQLYIQYQLSIGFYSINCGLSRPHEPVHPPWPAMCVHPETNRHNITGLTAHTIVGRAQGAL